MAHSYKKKNYHNASDEDDYVYPTKRVRENTRNRRSDRKLIKAGLIEHNNIDLSLDDWYDDEPMVQTNEEITNQAEYEDKALDGDDETITENDVYGTHWDLEDINTKWDHRWEDH